MTEHKAIKDEIKENTPSFAAGLTAHVVGALALIVNELRILNENLERLNKNIGKE